jgi:hypothetical protein
MPKPSSIQPLGQQSKVALLVYGHPGSGKTVLLSTHPRTLIIRPMVDHTVSVPIPNRKNCEEAVVTSWPDMWELRDYLLYGTPEDDFDWVWLDSISAFQEIGLQDIFDVVVAAKPHRAGGPIDRGEYGENMRRLADFVRLMVGKAHVHFGITAWPFPTEGPEGEDVFMPWVQGKAMPERICGYMNVIGYLSIHQKVNRRREKVGEPYRTMFTNLTNRYYAKDQFDAFGGELVAPTMPKIMDAIMATGRLGTAAATPRAATRRTARRRPRG